MQELRFFRPLAGRTDSGRSPERGGGRKVGARRSTTCSDASTRNPSPLLASPMVSTPTPAPPRQGGGNGSGTTAAGEARSTHRRFGAISAECVLRGSRFARAPQDEAVGASPG